MPYIYKLTLLEDTESFKKGQVYIGQSQGRQNSYFSSGSIPLRLRRKYGRAVFDKEIIVSGEFNQTLIDELEKHYIRLNASNITGLNIRNGGRNDIPRGTKKVSQYSAMGDFIQEYPSNYRAELRTGVSRDNIRSAILSKQKAGGFYWSYDKQDNIVPYQEMSGYKKRVFQYSPEGEFIQEFTSINEAARSTGLVKSSIRTSIANKLPTKGLWYTNERVNTLDITGGEKLKRWRPVHMFTTSGEYVKSFVGAAEAAKELNINSSEIRRVAREQKGHYGGYQWRYNKSVRLEASKMIK